MTLVCAAIAPHGDLAIPELCGNETRDLARQTQLAMNRLGEAARAARPDVVVIASPHHLHLEGSFGVVTSGRLAGELAASGPGVDGDGRSPRIELDVPVDRDLARELLDAFRAAGLVATGVSYGSNVPTEAVMPMDWGTLIPLWYLGGRWEPPLPAVAITPARDLEGPAHVEAGRQIGRVLERSSRRTMFVASADQSHTHDPQGPYGGDPGAEVFDRMVVDAVRANDLSRLREVPVELIEAAKPDSWWQLLMLDGVLETAGEAAGEPFRGELLSYEAPTYYGMLTALFARRTSRVASPAG